MSNLSELTRGTLMDNLYIIDVRVVATAYIKAGTEEEAFAKVKKLHLDSLHVSGGSLISDLQLDDPDLPEISLSPEMTIGEAFPDFELAGGNGDGPGDDENRDDERDEEVPIGDELTVNLLRLRYIEATAAFGDYMDREGIKAKRSGWLPYSDEVSSAVCLADENREYTHNFDVEFKTGTADIVHIQFAYEQPF